MIKLLDYFKRQLRLAGEFSPIRSLLLLLAIGGIIGTGIWLFSSASEPKLVYLTSKTLSKSQLSQVTGCLEQWGRAYRINGSYILVEPTCKEDLLSRLDFLGDGSQSEGGDYSSVSESSGIFLSQAQRQHRWNLSREKALASQIRDFRGLRAARVFLGAAERGGLGSRTAQARASVIVHTENDQPLSLELAQAIRQALAGSVAGLEADNVRVVNASNGEHMPVIRQEAGHFLAAANSTDAVLILGALDRWAQQRASQWEEKIRDKLSHIPKMVISVQINPRSLLVGSDSSAKPVGSPVPSASEPQISISLNIPRSYLLSLYRSAQGSDADVSDSELEPVAAEQIERIIATVRAIIGHPASGHVHVDWYHDNPPIVVQAPAQSQTLADTSGPASWFSDWLGPAHIGLALAVLVLALLAVVLVRWITDSKRRQRAIALARLDAERRHPHFWSAPELLARPSLRADSTYYRGPNGLEVSGFEELASLDEATLRGLLTRTQTQIIALALRTAPSKLRHRILGSLSCEHRQAVLDHPDFQSPVRLSDIEAAQQELVDLLDIPDHSSPELVGTTDLSAT